MQVCCKTLTSRLPTSSASPNAFGRAKFRNLRVGGLSSRMLRGLRLSHKPRVARLTNCITASVLRAMRIRFPTFRTSACMRQLRAITSAQAEAASAEKLSYYGYWQYAPGNTIAGARTSSFLDYLENIYLPQHFGD